MFAEQLFVLLKLSNFVFPSFITPIYPFKVSHKKPANHNFKDLEGLIKSLSAAEKRHFTLLSATFTSGSKEPQFLKLFHLLQKPESEISEQEKLTEFTALKSRLFTNILRSLRMFHQSKSIEINIQNSLSDIEILYSLSLPKQAYYIYRKAYAQVVTYEKFTLWLQLLEWEKKLNIILDNPERSIDKIAAEEREVLGKLTQLLGLENRFSGIKNFKRQHGQVRGILNNPIYEELASFQASIKYEDCSSRKAQFYFNFTNTIFNWITYNHKEAYLYSKRLLTSNLQDILPVSYIDAVLEHTTSCIHIGKFGEALDVLEKARTIAAKHDMDQNPLLNTKIFFYTVGYHLVIYNFMGDKVKLDEAITRAENEIKLYEQHMPWEARQVLNANLMNAYVGVGNLKRAEELWESLFHKSSKSIRRSIYDDLRLFRLLILLQNKVYAIIASAALSALRYYNQLDESKTEFQLEIKMTGILQKDHQWDSPKIRRQVLGSLKILIQDYISAFENANNFVEHYNLYLIWIDSIINDQPFYVAAARWYESFVANVHP